MRRLKLVLLWTSLLSVIAAAHGVLSLTYPELVNSDLRLELAATGLVIGRDGKEQMKARYGSPSRTVQEYINTKYEYAPSGILFRFDSMSGRLNWVEITGSDFHTGKGIKVGDRADSIRQAYGEPTEQVEIGGLTRLRYRYGIRYSLDFWISPDRAVVRILMYRG